MIISIDNKIVVMCILIIIAAGISAAYLLSDDYNIKESASTGGPKGTNEEAEAVIRDVAMRTVFNDQRLFPLFKSNEPIYIAFGRREDPPDEFIDNFKEYNHILKPISECNTYPHCGGTIWFSKIFWESENRAGIRIQLVRFPAGDDLHYFINVNWKDGNWIASFPDNIGHIDGFF